MDIQVVLTNDDPKLGRRGQVVKVSPGFAQNFLFPHKKAVPATPANIKAYENEKAQADKREQLEKAEAQAIADKILALTLTLPVRTGDSDKLYGAVTSHEIHDRLASQGISLDKKNIHLSEPIKKLGTYEVLVKTHRDISAKLKLKVVKQD